MSRWVAVWLLSIGIVTADVPAVLAQGAGAGARGGAGAEAAPPSLTDPQIAHVAVTANAIDAELAGLVESRTTEEGVRAFARTMINDHTAVNEQAAALARRLGVTPEDNAVSQSLRSDADAVRQRLTGLNGAPFARAYLEREVAYHQAVLEALDGVLIPGASNQELKQLLQSVRPVVEAHHRQARTLLESVGASR